MSGVYVHQQLEGDQRLVCRLSVPELAALLESERICFQALPPVWPASDAGTGSTLGNVRTAGAVGMPMAWRERLRLVSGGAGHADAWRQRQHVVGVQRWYQGLPDASRRSAGREAGNTLLVESSVQAMGRALFAEEGAALVLAPVRYSAPAIARGRSPQLPDLFYGRTVHRREREVRALLLSACGEGADAGASRVLALDARALVRRVLVHADAPAGFLDEVRALVRSRIPADVEPLDALAR